MGSLARYVTAIAAVVACTKGAEAAGFIDIESVGLPVEVRAVAVDRQGFLWVAGAQGVCRYDGADWFCPEERAALTLHVDEDNCVWAGLADRNVIALHPPGRRVRMWGQASETINDLAHANGTLWLATGAGLYTSRTNTEEAILRQILFEPVSKIANRGGDTVLASAGRRILSIDSHSNATTVATFGSAVGAMIPTRDSKATLVGTMAGTLHRLAAGQVLDLPVKSEDAPIVTLCEDAANNIWLGSGARLQRFDPKSGRTTNFNDAPGLPHNLVYAIAFDGTARLWLGTPAGLAQMRLRHPLRSFPRYQGLLTDVSFAVTERRDGSIWAATGPGVAGWKNGWMHNLGPAQGLADYDSRTVAVDSQDTLWIGGFNTGIYALVGGTAVKQWPRGSSAKRGVRSLRPRRKGGLWVGLNAGGLGTFVDGKFALEFEPRAEGRDVVVDMVEKANGDGVWLALSHDGLGLWQNGELKRYGATQGLPAVEILSLADTNDGRMLWLATNGAGLARFDGERFALIGASQGLIDDRIFGVVTADSHLWMSSPLAIGAAALTDLDAVADGKLAKLAVHSFGMADGVPGEPIRAYPPSAFRSIDGTVWFPTMRGLVNLDPNALGKAGDSRPISFDDVQVNGFSVIDGAKAPHPSLRAGVVFKFASPEYSASARLGFRYKLEGLEAPSDGWHTVQQGREARYENVPPGAYRFRVQKVAGAAAAVVESSFALHLPKPWHASWVFRGCLGGLLLALLFTGARRGVRQIEKTHEAVLMERARIARDIHDTLEQDLLGLRLQVDAAAASIKGNPQRSEENLARACDLITDAVVDLRNSIWSLKSSKVTTGELVHAVRARLLRLTAGSTLALEVRHIGHSRVLAATEATHAVHVAREAVTNAIKHARATSIFVTFDTTDVKEVTVQIEDNGLGMPAEREAATKGHLAGGQGLTIMRSRATALGGSLTIETIPKGGTRVTLHVPTTSKRRKRG